MVKKTRTAIPKLGGLVSQINQSRAKGTGYMAPTAIFFISFDIFNSTAYKASHPDTWSHTMKGILRHIISTFEISPIGGYSYWKSLGDEIIYTKNVVRVSDLPVMLDEIYAKMEHLNHMIADGVFCDKESGQILGIKGTAWICDVSSSAEFTGNVFTQYVIKDNRRQMDYAGPEIDIGFRVSKYSIKNRLVISWGLSYLLTQALSPEQYKQKVHVLTLKQLAGVWDGNPYPVVLYHGNEAVDFDESIIGCNSDKENILQEYLAQKLLQTLSTDEQYFCYSQKIILELGRKMGLLPKIEKILQIMDSHTETNYVAVTH